MNKEEAIINGIRVRGIMHNMKRRCRWHNYSQKGTYMLTLVVDGRRPLLGRVVEVDPSTELKGTRAYVEKTELGRQIEEVEIKKIKHYYPMIDVWKVCIMPDHIHIILRVKEDLLNGLHLGKVIAGFKLGCNRAYWGICPSAELRGTVAGNTVKQRGTVAGNTVKQRGTVAGNTVEQRGTVAGNTVEQRGVVAGNTVEQRGTVVGNTVGQRGVVAGNTVGQRGIVARNGLFEVGYNDKILLRDGQLENWKAYLDDNPRRLLIKQRNPHLFTIMRDMNIAGQKCQIVGNSFLLDIPDKVAVIVHRRYTEMEMIRLRKEWLECGERGGVLVSADISPVEKEVLREVMDLGYRIILLRENGFSELYKPSGESFYACSEGRLLQVSPWGYHTEKKTISREQCLELNAMAEMIAETPQRN